MLPRRGRGGTGDAGRDRAGLAAGVPGSGQAAPYPGNKQVPGRGRARERDHGVVGAAGTAYARPPRIWAIKILATMATG